MAEIRLLDKSVSELIAAGEVIERPSSVIKELCENAIDAGARHVTVEVKNGGISYMRISDDGCGIAFEQVPTAFLRHATSKIADVRDLESIHTLGFRGEALASVAAVTRAEMLTKRAEDELGTSFKLDGGEPYLHEAAGCPNGTTIILRDLFFNTPARLKFLKRDVSEGNYVQSVVEKLALVNPQVAFTFIRDNRRALVTPGDGRCFSAIHSVFGKQFAASLTEVDYSYGGISVSGYISAPHACRANRQMQYFFVNGRSIRNTTCMAALEEGYRNSVMVGKFPACVLMLELPPENVDANVSPSKTEVRFSAEKSVFETVYLAVKNAILNADNSRELILDKPKPEPAKESFFKEPETVVFKQTKFEAPPAAAKVPPPDEAYSVCPPVLNSPKAKYEVRREQSEPKASEENRYSFISSESFEKPKSEPDRQTEPIPEHKPLKYIGELFKTYILCESGDELILIDKHAAHERLRFEQLKTELVPYAQLLNESVFVTLSQEETTALEENLELLEQLGIELILTDCQAEITAFPSILGMREPEDILLEVAELLLKSGKGAREQLFGGLLHSFACKGAIKSRDNTSDYELETLAKRIWEDESIRYCPHGRPIITTISKHAIEKNFGRIQ